MAILKDKKVVIIGDRDGVPGPANELMFFRLTGF